MSIFWDRLILALTLACMAATPAAATTYYVNTGGSDSNPGSLAQPWQSITKVNSVSYLPGDSILFQGGQSFSGSILLGVADQGTAIHPITISSYGAGSATIVPGTGSGFVGTDCAGIIVSNLILSGGGASTNTSNGVAFICDSSAPSAHLSSILVQNVSATGFGQHGILFYSSSISNGYSNVTITGCTTLSNQLNGIYIALDPSIWPGAKVHQNILIDHCSSSNNLGQGSSSPYGSGIEMSFVQNGMIQYCVAASNGSLNTSSSGPVGIWAWESDSVVIQYCESYNNTTGYWDGDGFDLDGGMTNSTMQYNYSHGNAGAGFFLCEFAYADAYSGNTVRYNVSEDDARLNSSYFGGICVYGASASYPVTNSQVYNNTVYMDQPASGSPAAFLFDNTFFQNVSAYNNILYTNAVANLNGPANGQAHFNGNDYFNAAGSILITWNGTNYTSLASWQGASGMETGTGTQANPQLANPGNGGTLEANASSYLLPSLSAYKLLPASPLINTGLNLQTLYSINPGLQDFYGTSIPQGGAYDVGANEFIPAASPSSTATATWSPTRSPTPSISSTDTVAPSHTASPSPSPTCTVTSQVSATDSPTAGPSATDSATASRTSSATPSWTSTPSLSASPSPGPSLTSSTTPTASPSPSQVPSASASPTPGSLCTGLNLLANPSFGSGSLSPWVTTGADIDIVNINNPYTGSWAVYGGWIAGDAISLSQTVTGLADCSYTLGIWISTETAGGAGGEYLKASTGGVTLSMSTPPVAGTYTYYSMTVAVSNGTLEILAGAAGTTGNDDWWGEGILQCNGCGGPTATPTASTTPSASPTAYLSATPSVTLSATPALSPSSTASALPSWTASPSPSPSASATQDSSPSPSNTSAPTAAPSPSFSCSPSPTATVTAHPSPSASPTPPSGPSHVPTLAPATMPPQGAGKPSLFAVPNPISQSSGQPVTFVFTNPQGLDGTNTEIDIFSVAYTKVMRLSCSVCAGPRLSYTWNGKNSNGSQLARGYYYALFKGGDGAVHMATKIVVTP